MKKEEFELLTGQDAWSTAAVCGLPSLRLSDGPHGLRYVVREEGEEQIALPSTCYPTLSALGNSFDTGLVYRVGQALAEDCIAHDVAVILGPGVNLKRTPLCGRNFEYFSEDGVLAGTLAKAYIEGVQSKGVGTSLKHFAANNREYDRFFQSSELDERTLRETYCRAFEIALRAQPWTVMCSYNPINGILASENTHLLREILRGALGFDGVIVSDWGSVRHRGKSLRAGIDLAMPYTPSFLQQLSDWDDRGLLGQETQEAVGRLRRLAEKYADAAPLRKIGLSLEEKHTLAVEAAAQSAVLLKNDGILPLKKEGNIAVIGAFSEFPELQGGGSSRVNASSQKALHIALSEDGYSVTYAPAYMIRHHILTPFGYRFAIDAAREADIAVVCVGNTCFTEKEETDRESIRLSPTLEDLVNKVAQVNANTVLLLYAGSAVDISAVADRVSAVLYMGFGGEGVNEAAAKLLTGECVPCGKLAETFPRSLEETATGAATGNSYTERYPEGGLVGYRYYEYYGLEPAYPFGFGLSYTQFSYSGLVLEKHGETDYTLRFSVKNTGTYDAGEIVQIYLADDAAMVTRAKKELVRFGKQFFRAGETKKFEFRLNARDFAYFSPNLNDWYVENGTFTLLVGASSRDIRLAAKITVTLPDEEQFSQN